MSLQELAPDSTTEILHTSTKPRPSTARAKIKVPKKSQANYIFPTSHSQKKIQIFHPYTMNIKSAVLDPISDFSTQLRTRRSIPTQNEVSKFSLQSIPEKEAFYSLNTVFPYTKREKASNLIIRRPNTAKIVRNESDARELNTKSMSESKFLPKKGKECASEMMRLWSRSEEVHQAEESEEVKMENELMLRISDIDHYLRLETKSFQVKNPMYKTNKSGMLHVRQASKERFYNFGMQVCKKPLTQRTGGAINSRPCRVSLANSNR